jgi:hypothetical protein
MVDVVWDVRYTFNGRQVVEEINSSTPDKFFRTDSSFLDFGPRIVNDDPNKFYYLEFTRAYANYDSEYEPGTPTLSSLYRKAFLDTSNPGTTSVYLDGAYKERLEIDLLAAWDVVTPTIYELDNEADYINIRVFYRDTLSNTGPVPTWSQMINEIGPPQGTLNTITLPSVAIKGFSRYATSIYTKLRDAGVFYELTLRDSEGNVGTAVISVEGAGTVSNLENIVDYSVLYVDKIELLDPFDVLTPYSRLEYDLTISQNIRSNDPGSGSLGMGGTILFDKNTNTFNVNELIDALGNVNLGIFRSWRDYLNRDIKKTFRLGIKDPLLQDFQFFTQITNSLVDYPYKLPQPVTVRIDTTLTSTDPIVSSGDVTTNEIVVNPAAIPATEDINTTIEQWWETEVKPELEAINTTLQSILAQQTSQAAQTTPDYTTMLEQINETLAAQIIPDYSMVLGQINGTLEDIEAQLTPVTPEAQGEVFADQISRLRYLADSTATEADGDNKQGSGIRVSGTTAYNDLEKANLMKSLVLEGGILNYQREIAENNLQSQLNPPEGIEEAASQRIQELVGKFDQLNTGS